MSSEPDTLPSTEDCKKAVDNITLGYEDLPEVTVDLRLLCILINVVRLKFALDGYPSLIQDPLVSLEQVILEKLTEQKRVPK